MSAGLLPADFSIHERRREMSKKASSLYNLLMALVFSLVFTLLGQLLGSGRIVWSEFPVSYLIGLVLGFCVVQFVPCAEWGAKLGLRLGAISGSFAFDSCVNIVVSLIMSVILTTVMTIFGMTIMGCAPVRAALMTALKSIPLYTAIAFVIGSVIGKPLRKAAIKLAGKR